jgi:hypothetical protein
MRGIIVSPPRSPSSIETDAKPSCALAEGGFATLRWPELRSVPWEQSPAFFSLG